MPMALSALNASITSSTGLRRFRRASMPASARMGFRSTVAPRAGDVTGVTTAVMSSPADRGQPPAEPTPQGCTGPAGGSRRSVLIGEEQVPVVDAGIDQVGAGRRLADVADPTLRRDPRLDPTGAIDRGRGVVHPDLVRGQGGQIGRRPAEA